MRNRVFKSEHVEEVYRERLEICKGCESFDVKGEGCVVPGTGPCCDNRNGGCGCSLSLKLRSLSSECPKKKWEQLTSLQEEEFITSQIRENETENKR